MARYLGGALDAEQAWGRVIRSAGHWAMLGFGFWVVRERESGRFVGEAGFGDFRRTLDPPFGDAPEMGWTLARWAQGQGFAREAVEAALAWGSPVFGPVRVVCMIDDDNEPSLKLAARLGFSEYGRASYQDTPVILLERSLPPLETFA
ncbi:RimJ/RimL family protein N-acetyltransferase [Caulobacter ginsengisoli]|uniref:RimJ/RimL family protein N-acetyltransferase n=1 Tax=Caulobacter ginsengisoli TaxID=400775 RepID=A0ABU0IVY9_9CAUL|nr:RimJ/RimL family protein N-acetyltransferase [Caulobacter ginsengisoli]